MTPIDSGLSPLTYRLWAMWLCGCFGACSPGPDTPMTQNIPTLDAIRSQLTPREPSDHNPIPSYTLLQVIELDIPLKTDTHPAWVMTSTQGLDPKTISAWRANGMRIGMLPADHGDTFLKSLGGIQSSLRHRLILSENLTPLTISPPLPRPMKLKVELQPEHPQTIVLEKGRCQFLVRVSRDARGDSFLELIPHHHRPRTTLHPRLPQEKALDGRIFETLRFQVPIPLQGLLVIGLDTATPHETPTHKPTETKPKTATTQPAAPPATQPHQPSATPTMPITRKAAGGISGSLRIISII